MNSQLQEGLTVAIWWSSLSDTDRDFWSDEAKSLDPAACFKLYWSRGPMINDADLKTISKGCCPACRKRGFVIGPAGGASLNIECANTRCRDRYNVVFISGTAMIGHHLGNGATGIAWPSEPIPRPAPEEPQ